MASKGKKIFIHVVIILLILIAGPLIYDVVSNGKYHGNSILLFSGTFLYLAYFIYWILQVKNRRTKIILSNLLILFSLSALASEFYSNKNQLIIALPIAFTFLLLVLSGFFRIKRKTWLSKTLLHSFLILLPLAIFITFLFVMGAGRNVRVTY